jgi:hypothetical protein
MNATRFRANVAGKATTFKEAFRSREGFRNFIQTHDTALDQHGHPGSKARWSNEDLDPTPPEKRTCKSLVLAWRGLRVLTMKIREVVEFCHVLSWVEFW